MADTHYLLYIPKVYAHVFTQCKKNQISVHALQLYVCVYVHVYVHKSYVCQLYILLNMNVLTRGHVAHTHCCQLPVARTR